MKTESKIHPIFSEILDNINPSKAQHIAGEWKTEECSNGGLVVILGEEKHAQRIQVINEANAKLIAAAPELLQACVNALDKLRYMTTDQFQTGEDIAVRKELAQAIKKATE